MKYVTALARYFAFVTILMAVNPDAHIGWFMLLGLSASIGWSTRWDK